MLTYSTEALYPMLLFCLQDAVLGVLVISWEAQHETLGGPIAHSLWLFGGTLVYFFFFTKGTYFEAWLQTRLKLHSAWFWKTPVFISLASIHIMLYEQ